MAEKKITELDELTSLATGDKVHVVDISDTTHDATGTSKWFSLSRLANWIKTQFTASDLGLENVDNTSDADKPISTATQTALNGKAETDHSHAIAEITDLQTVLNGKAETGHGHTIGEIESLQAALDEKSATGHSHAITDITDLQAVLNGKSNTGHSHTYASLTDKPSSFTPNAVSSFTTITETVTNITTALNIENGNIFKASAAENISIAVSHGSGGSRVFRGKLIVEIAGPEIEDISFSGSGVRSYSPVHSFSEGETVLFDIISDGTSIYINRTGILS